MTVTIKQSILRDWGFTFVDYFVRLAQTSSTHWCWLCWNMMWPEVVTWLQEGAVHYNLRPWLPRNDLHHFSVEVVLCRPQDFDVPGVEGMYPRDHNVHSVTVLMLIIILDLYRGNASFKQDMYLCIGLICMDLQFVFIFCIL